MVLIVSWSCMHNLETEKHQSHRDHIVNVHERVKEIKISENDVLFGPVTHPAILGNYLIITNPKTIKKLIYIFDKNTFKYITGIAYKGQGPGEITNMGHLATDEANRRFYVSDFGKQVIFSYDLDSILINPFYLPQVKIKMDKDVFPDRYQFINDTLSYCRIIESIGNSDFQDGVGVWDMNTGEIKRIGNKHSRLEKNRIGVAVSMENGIYVEYSYNYDLLTICNLNGDLKCNIYGPNWSSKRDRKDHYDKVIFIKNKIFASYGKGNYQTNEYIPTKFLVFGINGDYLQTIEIGYWIIDYCYDMSNNLIIMCLNDEKMQFAYLDLDGLID